jgi:hypothetical protein
MELPLAVAGLVTVARCVAQVSHVPVGGPVFNNSIAWRRSPESPRWLCVCCFCLASVCEDRESPGRQAGCTGRQCHSGC